MMRRNLLAMILGLAGIAAPAPAQLVQTPTQQEEQRCFKEEKHRDRLALERYGRRTRDDQTIRNLCQAEVRRNFDDRVLGRPPAPRRVQDDILPVQNPGALGSRLAIGGTWHSVGTEVQADNRFHYFMDTKLMQRGPVGEAWLVSVFERVYPNGAASKAYRVRVDCATGRWAYRYHGDRDAALRVIRAYPVNQGWQPRVANPQAPIERLRATVCDGASPGHPLPAAQPTPSDYARSWFAQNPR